MAMQHKGPSIKDVRSQGRGRFDQCGHFSDKGEGVLQMRTSALFGAKDLEFFKIYGVSARTRGQFFAILCGCLLWTLRQ